MANRMDHPLFFERNRVRRVYTGGKLFHEFFGDEPEDGDLPEEWIASAVRALNRESASDHEGVSLLRGTRTRFDEVLVSRREDLLGDCAEFGILVKVLDSAIRLPIQAHPTKDYARRHFGSPHGKTEMWVVLATRPGASIYYGLKEGVTLAVLKEAVDRAEEDREALPSLLNRLPARPGDVYLIPAGVAHAIGAGCLILEVQEPTDFTIQPEPWCGDYHLNADEMYIGLEPDIALTCFDFTQRVGKRAIDEGRKTPKILSENSTLCSELLVGPADTPDFSVYRHSVQSGSFTLPRRPAVFVVTAGAGEVIGEEGSTAVRKGSYFFLPAASRHASVTTDSKIEIVECIPPCVSDPSYSH